MNKSEMSSKYLMENPEEGKRLELKTDKESVLRQARWAGIGPGMRVADVGCGPGFTTSILSELVGPTGAVVGVDNSSERISYAKDHYGAQNVTFVKHDILSPFVGQGEFDAIWSRFFIEYFRDNQRQVIRNTLASLRVRGIACIADIDNNSVGHYGLSERLEKTLLEIRDLLEKHHNFDPFAGRRLFDHFYHLGYEQINVLAEMHHLVFGVGDEADQFNWMKKLEVAAGNSGCKFPLYDGDFAEFRSEFAQFLKSPNRFTFSPVFIVRGIKPSHDPF